MDKELKAQPQPKKSYSPPELMVYGTLGEITQIGHGIAADASSRGSR